VVQGTPGNPRTVSLLWLETDHSTCNYDSEWNQPDAPRVTLASPDTASGQGEGTAAPPHLCALSPAPHSVSSSPYTVRTDAQGRGAKTLIFPY